MPARSTRLAGLASLHLLMAVGGMVSFGHAAYFGLGAYGAALLLKLAGLPMPAAFVAAPLVAALAAAVFGYFCVRLTSIYFAMLTLAFAQIVYAIVHQWDDVTGGDTALDSPVPDYADEVLTKRPADDRLTERTPDDSSV